MISERDHQVFGRIGLGFILVLNVFQGARGDDDLISTSGGNESAVCNKTAWNNFLLKSYSNERERDLRTASLGDSTNLYFAFWGVRDTYFSDDMYTMTNQFAMEKAAEFCQLAIRDLNVDRSGDQGPIEDYWLYQAMCTDFCIESDALHKEALELSACTCLEVSTPMTVDVCLKNSAAMLCVEYNNCGLWKCPIDDFMCPRYEYNTKMIKFRGPGSCLSSANPTQALSGMALFLGALVTSWLLAFGSNSA